MKVCIVGAGGYIGSVLTKGLKRCDVTCIKRGNPVVDIINFDIVIYLAGNGRKGGSLELTTEPDHSLDIAKSMNRNQLLVYASTTAIYESITDAKEGDQINLSLLDSYTRTMYQRERDIQSLDNVKSIGLRLATVVGLSSNQRADRIHLQMLKSALFTGRIKVQNPNSKRPIISMDETLAAFQAIIDKPKFEPILSDGMVIEVKHAIYNVSSFNTTVAAIAISTSLLTGAKIAYQDNINNIVRDFSVNGSRFQERYELKFDSTNESILKDLILMKQELLNSWSNPVVEHNCLICGNNIGIEMVNLNNQPLANQF